ncbi:MAG: polysaccharide biosynthesis protein [Nitrospirae bacterium]|nr:MAG: polysaccharide biosynthesis protein [Nitrospirota bacterium]
MGRAISKFYVAVRALIIKNRRFVVVLGHMVEIVLANYLAFLLRFDGIIPKEQFQNFSRFLLLLLVIRIFFYVLFGLYKDLWRYSSISDLARILKSVTAGSIVFLVVVRFLLGHPEYPRSIYFLDWLMLIMISGGARFATRIFREYLHSSGKKKTVLIIGAGDAGEMLARDMKKNDKYSYEPIGFIDDNVNKSKGTIHGIPILGTREVLAQVIEEEEPDEILIAMPSAGFKVLNEIYDVCKPFGLPVRTVPAMHEILDGNVTVSQIRPLSLEDLLQREQISPNIGEVSKYCAGKAILVTGAGGSIGSELCRQIMRYSPSRLILFDRYENGLFDIDLELRDGQREGQAAAVDLQTVVGDMRDPDTLEYLFDRFKPQIVFHAAAHKHVPLMELNPFEAVRNNVFGTMNLLRRSLLHEVEHFVMISTDKAVNPTNIMGGTKRIAEFLTMAMNKQGGTKFTTVRFGNVLGSNGSVVSIFREQVKRGGPVTVTHPDIKRYFMLIPEAVQLVLLASAAGSGGEIFVLDMGEQILIRDLAENLIRLSGFVPNEEIRIVYTGLRPGEKLYEELFDQMEKSAPTTHPKLRSAIPDAVPALQALEAHLKELEAIIAGKDLEALITEMRKIVPNFKKG